MNGDPTMAGCTDPAKRMRKLNERRQHIEDQIHELQDKHMIIEHEIGELSRECPSS